MPSKKGGLTSAVVNGSIYVYRGEQPAGTFNNNEKFDTISNKWTSEKSIIERTMKYLKDRTEGFDDYFPWRKKKCKLNHVIIWLNLFVGYHNKEINLWTAPNKVLDYISKGTCVFI